MLKIYVTNLGRYNEGELIYEALRLPYIQGELQEVLDNIGINERYEEYFITDYETDLNINIGEYESIDFLNECMEELANHDIDIINGIIEHYTSNLKEVVNILSNKDICILDNIKNNIYLGYALIHDIENIDVPDCLNLYINYEQYAIESDYYLIDNEKAIRVLF